MTLVFATGNANKLKEVQALMPAHVKLLGLTDIECHEDIPETQPTIEGNAIQKARYVADNYDYDCFADDTGLEVRALNGEPGVLSARYAGPEKDPDANMNKLLSQLDGKDRRAQFKTVIALVVGDELRTFTGICEGTITAKRKGHQGFGYDPIFQPDGHAETFAEMDLALKNRIGHRGRAINQLIDFLESQ